MKNRAHSDPSLARDEKLSSVSSFPPRFKVLTACLGLIVINLAVTIKSFAIILSFGVQPVAPVEFE